MQLDKVGLAVRDLDRSVAFYREAIGLELLADGDRQAELGFAGKHRLTLVERATAAPRGNAAGLFHVAWLLGSRAHLGAALGRLAEAGIGLTGAADHHVSEAVYLDDPDGHGIELYADRPEETWQRNGALVMTNSRLDLNDLVRTAAAAGIAPEASSRGATLGHIHLEAADLAAATHFATTSLGLDLQADWPHAKFLGWNGYHHHLAYNDWNGRQHPLDGDANRIGLIDIGLSASGLLASGLADDQPGRTLTDPNGIRFTIA
jgi:catechol 2,3-dioxygenase